MPCSHHGPSYCRRVATGINIEHEAPDGNKGSTRMRYDVYTVGPMVTGRQHDGSPSCCLRVIFWHAKDFSITPDAQLFTGGLLPKSPEGTYDGPDGTHGGRDGYTIIADD